MHVSGLKLVTKKAETGAYIGKEVEHRCSKLWSTGDHQSGKRAVGEGKKRQMNQSEQEVGKKLTCAYNRQILYIYIVFFYVGEYLIYNSI